MFSEVEEVVLFFFRAKALKKFPICDKIEPTKSIFAKFACGELN